MVLEMSHKLRTQYKYKKSYDNNKRIVPDTVYTFGNMQK